MKKEYTNYTALDIFKHAEHFKVSGDYLAMNIDSPFTKIHLHLPKFALSAFSTELFLKCLIMIEQGQIPKKITRGKDGHNLEKLFFAVSQDSQDRILLFYDELKTFSKQNKPIAIQETLKRLNRWETDFLKELNESSDAFINFRYAFSTLSNYSAPYLRDATRRRILELNPNWINLIDEPDSRIEYGI